MQRAASATDANAYVKSDFILGLFKALNECLTLDPTRHIGQFKKGVQVSVPTCCPGRGDPCKVSRCLQDQTLICRWFLPARE